MSLKTTFLKFCSQAKTIIVPGRVVISGASTQASTTPTCTTSSRHKHSKAKSPQVCRWLVTCLQLAHRPVTIGWPTSRDVTTIRNRSTSLRPVTLPVHCHMTLESTSDLTSWRPFWRYHLCSKKQKRKCLIRRRDKSFYQKSSITSLSWSSNHQPWTKSRCSKRIFRRRRHHHSASRGINLSRKIYRVKWTALPNLRRAKLKFRKMILLLRNWSLLLIGLADNGKKQ